MVISHVSARSIGVIYPLLALTIGATPMQIGMATFALTVPGLLFYMPAGVLVDRLNPRLVMLIADTTRGAAILIVALATLCGWASVTLIILAALWEGALGVTHSLAEIALLCRLTPRDSAIKKLAASETGVHFAVLVGRPLGGLLLHLGAPLALLANGLFLFCSGGLLCFRSIAAKYSTEDEGSIRLEIHAHFRRLRKRLKDLTRSEVRADISNGVRELRRHAFMTHAIFATTTTNLAINTIIIMFMAGAGELSPVIVGLVLSAGGIGGAIGSNLAHLKIVQKFINLGTRALRVQMWIWVGVLAITTLTDPLFYGVATLLTGCVGSVMNVGIRTYEQENIDPAMLARVVSVHRFAAHSAVCVAAPIGGWLATIDGPHSGTFYILFFMIMAALWANVTMRRERPNVTARLRWTLQSKQPHRADEQVGPAPAHAMHIAHAPGHIRPSPEQM